MICTSCSFENPESGKFCGECAAPLGSKCPSCGLMNPSQFKFCGHCASPLDENAGLVGEPRKPEVTSSQDPPISDSSLVRPNLDPSANRTGENRTSPVNRFLSMKISMIRLLVFTLFALLILIGGLSLMTGAFGNDEVELRGYSETKYQRYVTATESAGKDPLDRGAWLEKERLRETEIRLECLEAKARGTDMSFMFGCN